MTTLPTNIDAAYPDDATRPGLKAHQQHHDLIHTLFNLLGEETATNVLFKSIIDAAGDLIVGTGADAVTRLPMGTARQNLGVNSAATGLAYQASMQSLLTATGDIPYASSANTPARLAAGTNGHVLTLAGGVPTWAAAGTVPANDSAVVATDQGTTSTSFTDLATAGPAVTVTTGTKALVIVSANMYNTSASGGGRMGFAVSGASTRAAAVADSLLHSSDAGEGNVEGQGSFAMIVTGLTAGSNVFTAKYVRHNAGTAQFQNRKIHVINMGS